MYNGFVKKLRAELISVKCKDTLLCCGTINARQIIMEAFQLRLWPSLLRGGQCSVLSAGRECTFQWSLSLWWHSYHLRVPLTIAAVRLKRILSFSTVMKILWKTVMAGRNSVCPIQSYYNIIMLSFHLIYPKSVLLFDHL